MNSRRYLLSKRKLRGLPKYCQNGQSEHLMADIAVLILRGVVVVGVIVYWCIRANSQAQTSSN